MGLSIAVSTRTSSALAVLAVDARNPTNRAASDVFVVDFDEDGTPAVLYAD